MIVNLVSKKGEINDNSSPQLTCIHNSLLMIIVDTPDCFKSNIDRKSDMRKVRKSSVNSSSTLFSRSIHSMYNRFNSDRKTSHVEVISSWD